MSNSSIWPIDRTLKGITLGVRVDLGAMAMKCISKTAYRGLLLGVVLSRVQRCTLSIPEPQPTGVKLICIFDRLLESNNITCTFNLDWLIMKASQLVQGFFAERLGNHIHRTFIFTFLHVFKILFFFYI